MGHINQTLVLFCLVGVAWLGTVPPLAAGQGGAIRDKVPNPEGFFQVRTIPIDPDQGVNWEDVELNFNNQNYQFVLKAQTYTASDVLNSLMGEPIRVRCLVYNLKNVADFAGIYTRVKSEVARAMVGVSSDAVFQNDKGVVMQVTQGSRSESVYLSLLGNSFEVLSSGF
jgi:hypothetical protein